MQKNAYLIFCCVLCLLSFCIISCEKITKIRAQHYYNNAKKFYDEGKYLEATEACDNALTFDPLMYDALYLRAMVYYQAGGYKESLDWFRKALQQQPDNIPLRMLFADAAIKAEKYLAAIKQYMFLVEKEPGNQEFLFLLQYARVKSRDDVAIGRAQNELAQLIQQNYNDPRIYCLAAELAILRNELPEAESLLAQHYTSHPIWTETMLLLADNYASSKNFDKVSDLYKNIIEKTDDKKTLQERLADILLFNKQYDSAEPVLWDLNEHYPDDMNVCIKLFECLKALKKFDAAERIISLAIDKHPDDFNLKKKKIELFIQKTDYDNALAEAKRILGTIVEKRSPKYLEIKNLIGDIYFNAGNLIEAQKCAEDVLVLQPNDTQARFTLCRIKIQTSAGLSLIGELRQLIGESPRNPEFYYYLGIAHKKRNEMVMAEKAFRESLAIDPSHKEALIALGELYFQQGAFSNLETSIREYRKFKPDDNETMQMLEAIKKKYMSQ